MAVKPIMGSYPYLTLAKKHGIRYELALVYGDMHTHGRLPGHKFAATTEEIERLTELKSEFVSVSDNFKQIVKEGWDQS